MANIAFAGKTIMSDVLQVTGIREMLNGNNFFKLKGIYNESDCACNLIPFLEKSC